MTALPSQIETVKVADLIAYPLNSKEHPQEQIDTLKYSLQKFGQTAPLVIDKDGVVIAGHGRMEAMRQLNIEECQVIRVSEWTEDMAKEYRILDNRSNESPWNWDFLSQDLSTFKSDILANLFPDIDKQVDINLEDYKLPEAPKEETEKAEMPEDTTYVRVQCVNEEDAKNCMEILKEAGYSLVTVE